MPFPNLRLRRSSFPPPSNLHLRPRPKNRGKEGQIGKEGRISIGEEGESLQLVRIEVNPSLLAAIHLDVAILHMQKKKS